MKEEGILGAMCLSRMTNIMGFEIKIHYANYRQSTNRIEQFHKYLT